jgi:hypothetical protein
MKISISISKWRAKVAAKSNEMKMKAEEKMKQ